MLPRPWQRLAGRIAPEVLHAPQTGADPLRPGVWPDVHERLVGYLDRNCVGTPWADHLALAAAVMTARRRDPSTVRHIILVLHPGFRRLFPALGLTTMADWQADRHLLASLRGEVLPADRQPVRTAFWKADNAATRQLMRWLQTLPDADRDRARPFALPVVSADHVEGFIKAGEVQRQQQETRKAETDALVPQFAAIRAEAHLRHTRLRRVHQACHGALQDLAAPQPPPLPRAFSYDEGDGLAHERLHFRLWDRRSFVRAHAERYGPETVADVRTRSGPFQDARNRRFLEFVQAERLASDAPLEGLWFEELLRRGLLHRAPGMSGADVAAEQAWLRAWGYGRPGATRHVAPFLSPVPGLLSWSRATGESRFNRVAQTKTAGVLIPVDSLWAAATFGVLAIDLFTTTGMRMNEAMQIRLTPEAFVRLVMPAPPGARDSAPRIRYAFRLIPKGERTDTPHTFFIGRETMRLLVVVATMLAEHYGLAPGAPLPTVAFNPHHGRAHRFGPVPYLFQYPQRHLSDVDITACMRFLLHGMVFRTRDGKPVVLKAHLLRHAFATHAVHVEKIPVDIVGEWLQQQVYTPRRQRTVDLVRHAVEALATAQRAVSLASIASTSKAIDPTGRGISTSAILGNPEARAHYERHRRWSGTRPPRPTPRAWADGTRPRVDAHRDVARARQRYRRWTKGLLIERLLAVERAYADQEDRWRRVNDELLAWQLRAAPARSDRDSVRANPIEVGVPHHGYESPVAHRGD